MTSNEEPFCGLMLLEFGKYYAANISGYYDVPICLVGVILNLCNVMVFTRKNMISPASVILTHLALVDLIVLLCCIPIAWYESILDKDNSVEQKWAYEWFIFTLYGTDFMAMMHSISVWLTVMLTIWRYIAVVHPSKELAWCNLKMTNYVVIVGYILCILICVPFYFAHDVKAEITNGRTTYRVEFTENSVLYAMVFVINGILLKLLPFVILTFFSFKLIRTLLEIRKGHNKLTSSPLEIQNKVIANIETKQVVDRSTSILLAVLVLCLTAEVPLGILGLLNVVYGYGIHHQCYNILGLIFNTVTIINTSITFVVYYVLNPRFRITFNCIFRRNQSIFPQNDTLSYEFSCTDTSQE